MSVVDRDLQAHYRSIHRSKSYGVSGDAFRPHVQVAVAELRPATVLNYGCGQTRLHEEIELFGARYFRYDPGIEEFSVLPLEKADFLINTDVLEHIPRASLDDVVGRLASLSQKALINISTRRAAEILPDGTNAHCTILSPEEWQGVLRRHFPVVELVSVRPGYSCLFLTWKSPLAEAIALLDEVPALRRRLAKAERSIGTSVMKELRRLQKRVFS